MNERPPTEIPPLPEYDGNPFIERLGPIRTLKAVQDSLNRPPIFMDYDRNRPPEERMHAVLRLLRFSQATVTAREVGLKVDQMIRQGYVGRNPCTTEWYRYAQSCADLERGLVEETRRARSSGRSQSSVEKVLDDLAPVNDTSQSCLVVGPPGAGKTHSLALALSAYPQVIVHDYPMRITQIVWLRVECPPNGSLKGLCGFFFAAVDKALREAGFQSDLEKEYRNRTLHVQLAGMARVANLHAVGILVINEIQHVKVSRGEGHSLLNVLVTLRNAIGVSLMMIGTMSALPILQRTFRDARRADGIGSISFSRMAPALIPDHLAKEGQAEGMSIVPVYGECEARSDDWRAKRLEMIAETASPLPTTSFPPELESDDRDYSIKMRRRAQILKRRSPPVRVSLAAVEQSLGGRDWLAKRRDRMPISVRAAKDIVEPVKAFRLRRMRWHLDRCACEGISDPWIVLRRAGLPGSFIGAIKAALPKRISLARVPRAQFLSVG